MNRHLRLQPPSVLVLLLLLGASLVACSKKSTDTSGESGGAAGSSAGAAGASGAAGSQSTASCDLVQPTAALIPGFDTSVETATTTGPGWGDFTSGYSGFSYVYGGPAGSLSNGQWHISGTVTSWAGIAVGFAFPTDASEYHGIEFTLSGTIGSGAPNGNVILDLGMVGNDWHDPDPEADPSCAQCESSYQYGTDCMPPQRGFRLMETPTHFRATWPEISGGRPIASPDAADAAVTALTRITWLLPNVVGAGTDDVTEYDVDLTISDVSFMTEGAGGSGGEGGSGGAAGSTSEGGAGSTATGPCDIYASGDTPCVAAHSTVRALYGSYDGSLYQVTRTSDWMTRDIGVSTAGGFADAAEQDEFCADTTCLITVLYDQSPSANHLTVGPRGGYGSADVEADAAAAPVSVGGHSVYALYVSPGTGYRNNLATDIATDDEPEGMYMVASGTHYNGECCFDYGNAETNSLDTGNGHMEAIYFGDCSTWGYGDGDGPWVMADLENGLFAGGSAGLYADNQSLSFDYVTAMLKGKEGSFAIRVGDAQAGVLTTMYDGSRPAGGYDPMHKEGAITLGVGGDNSNGSQGTFFEGCMTSGYPSDAIEDAVQENIVAAGYGG